MTEEQKLQKRYEKTTDSLIKASGIKPDTTKISKEEMIKRIQ